MPIYKGVNKIGVIYKGSSKIDKVYKGTILVYSAGYWLSYGFTYLYNSLVPTTIDSKLVKDKARIKKIYANGVIENQLLQDFTATNYWAINTGTLTNISNTESVFTLNNDAQYNSGLTVYTNTIVGHKYLLLATLKTSVDNANCNFRQDDNYLFFNSTTQYKQYTWIHEGTGKARMFCLGLTSGTTGDTMTIKNCMVIDLTLMFGTGNEPTALTDVRIQKILNSGYIAYNAGSYKGTDIREFSTTKVDTTSLATLSFIYQGNGALNSHDTLERLDTEWVFTKNTDKVDLGTLNYVYTATYKNFFCAISNAYVETDNTKIPNLLCSLYRSISTIDFRADLTKNMLMLLDNNSLTPGVHLRNLSYDNTTINDLKTAMSGVMLYYPLATPQVIRIPRKHLGIVDLGSLNWSYGSSSGHERMYCLNAISNPNQNNNVVANIVCSKYNTSTVGKTYDHSETNIIATANGDIFIYASDMGTDTTAFKNSLQGIYLFYETEDEVADIPFTLDIEAGGTITSDSDVLPNVDFDIKCK